jgi:hypothetical protein
MLIFQAALRLRVARAAAQMIDDLGRSLATDKWDELFDRGFRLDKGLKGLSEVGRFSHFASNSELASALPLAHFSPTIIVVRRLFLLGFVWKRPEQILKRGGIVL